MFLVSLRFLFFLAALICVYYLSPGRVRWVVLLVGSISFYFFAGIPWTCIYLLLTWISVWIGGLLIARYRSGSSQYSAKIVLVSVLLLNFGILAVLKYSNFFLLNTGRLFKLMGSNLFFGPVHFPAALGISFYTLQAAGYLVDVYRGEIVPQTNPGKMLLFLAWFPQMTSGPISRYGSLAPQLYMEQLFCYEDVCAGMQRMILGFAKKLILADQLSIYVSRLFDSGVTFRGWMIWGGMAGYVLQIYADFSGCMDIALGAAQCFGIKMQENFERPFHARSIQEFWKRWHITLGLWAQDYLMYPILRSSTWRHLQAWTKKHFGKKASRKLPAYLAMLILWLFIGLWHGGDWCYIAEVLWFWAVIVAGQLLDKKSGQLLQMLGVSVTSLFWQTFEKIRTAFVYAVGALFFMSGSVRLACRRIIAAITLTYLKPAYFWQQLHQYVWLFKRKELLKGMFSIIVGLVIMGAVVIIEARGSTFTKWLAERRLPVRWGILYFLLFSIILFGVYGPGYDAAAFIYGGF